MATEAQIKSNQTNSLGSTGPRTPSGKNASRQNSCRHGLAGSGGVVCPADRAKVEARAASLREEFQPESEFERSLVEQMAVDSIRMDRCHESSLVLRQDQANRAALCWDEDKRAEAEEIASRLGWDPARSRSKLEQGRHGCELLIERWEALGRILGEVGFWDDSQRSMALNLLGVPLELRAGTTAVDLLGGEPLELKAFRLGVVEGELDRLRSRKAKAFDLLDEHDRESAEAGIAAELTKPLRLLERYESACWRRQQAALRILNGRPRPPEPVAIKAAAPPRSAPFRPGLSRWIGRKRPAPSVGAKAMASMSIDERLDYFERREDERVAIRHRLTGFVVPPYRRT